VLLLTVQAPKAGSFYYQCQYTKDPLVMSISLHPTISHECAVQIQKKLSKLPFLQWSKTTSGKIKLRLKAGNVWSEEHHFAVLEILFESLPGGGKMKIIEERPQGPPRSEATEDIRLPFF
jgi:hypothetical protein